MCRYMCLSCGKIPWFVHLVCKPSSLLFQSSMLSSKNFQPRAAAPNPTIAQTQTTTGASARPRRTVNQPRAIQQAQSTAKRTRPKADSLNAPYVHLVPILDDRDVAMEIDGGPPLTRSGQQEFDIVKVPKLVRGHSLRVYQSLTSMYGVVLY